MTAGYLKELREIEGIGVLSRSNNDSGILFERIENDESIWQIE